MGQPTGVMGHRRPAGLSYPSAKRVRAFSHAALQGPNHLTAGSWKAPFRCRPRSSSAAKPSPPTLSDHGYIIAVYGVPFTDAQIGDPLSLAKFHAIEARGEERCQAGEREAFELERSVVVVYRFPYSAEISKKDGAVEFDGFDWPAPKCRDLQR